MAFDMFIQYLSIHAAVYYTILESLTSKIRRTTESIGFVEKSLNHKVAPTFATLKSKLINKNDKLSAEQALIESSSGAQRHLRTLCLDLYEISSKIKSNYCGTFHELIIINIISALRMENKLQLRYKYLQLFRLVHRKQDTQYQVPVLNLSTGNITTAPLQYGLHHSFTKKNKYVKRNVAVELEKKNHQIS